MRQELPITKDVANYVTSKYVMSITCALWFHLKSLLPKSNWSIAIEDEFMHLAIQQIMNGCFLYLFL